MLFTSVVRCRLISFSGLVVKSPLHVQVVSSVSKGEASVNADSRYGTLLRVDVRIAFIYFLKITKENVNVM